MSETTVYFDGETFRPEGPIDLKPNTRYRVVFYEVNEPEPSPDGKTAWDVLAEMARQYEGPADWSAEHDHYLYGTPKRGAEDAG